jgi:hypothetical protein
VPDPNVRPAVNHLQEAPPQERDLTELVAACVESFETALWPDLRENLNRRYEQYRGFRRWKDDWIKAGPNDRDGILRDTKQTWGAQLHIPLSFRTIETMVPRAIAHRPRLLYLPRREIWEENVHNVRLLMDAQQDQIDIDLPFQAVMRSGRIYGLGVGKSYWRKDYALRRRLKQSMRSRLGMSGDQYVPGRLEPACTFDDPMFEDVDIFDFMWDPYGSDMNTCEWVVHRMWFSLDRCLERIQSGAWNTVTAQMLDEDKLRGMGHGQKYDEIWQDRLTASGLPTFAGTPRGEQIHEVWEYHDGREVLTVIDRCALVQSNEAPSVGMIPFHVYRPTPLQKQMIGIGDLEPLEHLQRELDTLRSQRRDAATLALAAGYIYDDGAIAEDDLQFGPNAAIPVTNADVRGAIMPIPRQEVPGSAYQDEQVIRQDFDAVSGISDSLDPNNAQASTATEAQLVQASLSARIALASRRFEIEIVRQVAKCWLYLNQRMIAKPREVRVTEDTAGMDDQAEHRWKWFEVGPGELQGEYEIVPEGGSMAARNVPQDRQDAGIFLNQLMQNPYVDPKRPLMRGLELLGVRDPESWLKQTDPPVPPLALEALQKMGVNPALIRRAIMVAQASDPRLAPEQGPNVQQVNQAMGVNGNGGSPDGGGTS